MILVFFPELYSLYVTSADREFKKNCENVRNFLRKLVRDKREQLRKEPESAAYKSDILSILL